MGSEDEPEAVTAHDRMLAETIARHFEAAKLSGADIELGVAGLKMSCRVHSVHELGQHRAAGLFFWLRGGELGEVPIFASISGYGEDAEEAIVTGGCNWACSFGPVLRAALAGEPCDDAMRFDATIHGQRYRVVVDGLDRALLFDQDPSDPLALTRQARERLGAVDWLMRRVLALETLPLLPVDRTSIVSVFVSESSHQRTLEVKVNGEDWAPAQRLLHAAPLPAVDGAALLRELAVLVPAGARPPLARRAIEATLAGAASERPLAAWTGWDAHGGRLGRPASDARVRELEDQIGPLPAPYRAFLTTVAESGAGPGYGLLSPFGAAQAMLARGEFTWRDGEVPESFAQGALALAHAGCGMMWLLVVGGPDRGQVWLDGASSGWPAERAEMSFDRWYRRWLDGLVRGIEVFGPRDAMQCGTASVLSQLLESLQSQGMSLDEARRALPDQIGTHGIQLVGGDTGYFGVGAALDPCQPCVQLAAGLSIAASRFRPGIAPMQPAPDPSKPRGLFGRIASSFRRRS